MPWVNYEPANLYKGVPGTTLADLTLRRFGAATVPANTKVIINSIIACNTTANPATITLAHVDGTNVHHLLSTASVEPRQTLKMDGLDIVMEPGDKLQASQGTAGAIHLNISGAVVT
ncbi:hypothetical protein HRbin24_00546 [bacterium HR24]|nr:hypothetical protein HRbin24_00546 [bacterium HR24]